MRNEFAIFSTFIIAIMLMLLPIPEWAAWLRPHWVALVLIYWSMVMPHRVGVGMAWFLGILLDVLNGTLLGEHALALVIISFIVMRMYTRLKMYSILQQSLYVFGLVLLYQFILYCIQGFIGDLPRGWSYWASSLTSMFLWPWVYIILRDYRRRFVPI